MSVPSYKKKLGFTGQEAVGGIEYLVRGLARYQTLTEPEQQAFFADVLSGIVKVDVVNKALAKVDLPGISGATEAIFKQALVEGFSVELSKLLADAV